jgi:hypothetical protein
VTEGSRTGGRGSGRISARSAAWLAWALWTLIIATIGLGFLLWPVSEVALVPLVLSTAVPFAIVGAFVASRRPENPIGWLFIAFGAAAALRFTGSQYATYALLTHPGSLPAGDFIASFAVHLWHPGLGFLVFSFLLFPHGRLPSHRWRFVAWLSAISCAVALISGMLEYEFLREYTWPEDLTYVKPLFTGPVTEVAATVFWYSSMIILAMLFTSGGSLVLRLRRSVGEERQQLKWVVYSVALLAFLVPSTILVIIILKSLEGVRVFFAVLFPLIPISVGIAILKYRLYDIDVVINRTLVYGSLSALLALVYFLGVTAAGALLRTLTGQQEQQPQLAIVVSTLVIAALFNPLRRRIQGFIDRRFYRKKYDARKTLEAFSAKLRDETDLDALNAELVGVVKETMQPAHVSLWLRPDMTAKSRQAD